MSIKKTLNNLISVINKSGLSKQQVVIVLGLLLKQVGLSLGEKEQISEEELQQLMYSSETTLESALIIQGHTIATTWSKNIKEK